MKITRILAAACFALVVWLPINAQAQQAQVIASCGAQSLQVNAAPFMASFFMDSTGNLCTNASGGGGGGGLSVTDQAAWTNATSAFTPNGGVFNDSATALASGKQGTVRLNANREMHITCDAGNVLCGLINSPPPININGANSAWTGLTPGSAQTGTIVAPNTDQTSLGGVAYGAMANFGASPGAVKSPNANASMFAGTTAIVADPCQTATKVYTPINVVTGTNTIIAGVSAKKKYICSIMLFSAGTDNVAIFQSTTGTSCVTALVGVIGGTTTATGMQMTAQTGFTLGNGSSAVAATTVVNTDLCVVTSASVQMSGVVVTVDQ